MLKRIRGHYYWVIAALAVFEMAIYGGVINNYNSLFVIPVTETLGISRTAFTLAFSVGKMGAMVSNLCMNKLISRYGYRKLIGIALSVCATGVSVLALSRNLPMLFAGTILVGAGDGICATAGITWIIRRWFRRSQGTVLGVVTASTGISGSIFAIILTKVMIASGWQSAYWFCAGCFLVAAIILLSAVRDHPSCLGLKPYGEGEAQDKKHRVPDHYWLGYSEKEVKKLPSFYLTMITMFICAFGTYLVFYIVVPYLRDNGVSQTAAATVQSALMLGLCAGKILSGVVSDKLGAKWSMLLCAGYYLVGSALLALFPGVPIAYVVAWIYAMGIATVTINISFLMPDLFGYRSSGMLIGLCLAVIPLANTLGSTTSNVLYDLTGSYQLSLWLSFSLHGISLVLLMITFLWAKRDKRRWEELEGEESEQVSLLQGQSV
ncbi:MAG: MFS transporter [Ruminococcaceae bacterium]|nr:MFS transporter [Oscillospiraceae bacterium]